MNQFTMASLFKRIPVYARLSMNRMELTRLDTLETASAAATDPFSNPRLVVAWFDPAYNLMRSLIKQLGLGRKVFPLGLKMVIQQTEALAGGLTDVEARALRDLGEQAGAAEVIVVEHNRALSADEALALL